MALTLRAPRRGDLVLGTLITLTATALLLVMPVLGRADPELALSVPAPGAWSWWLTVAAIVAQGVALTWVSVAPGTSLVTVAALALGTSLMDLGDASSLPFIGVIAAAYVATRRRSTHTSWSPWLVAVALVAIAGSLANLRLDEGAVLAVLAAAAQAIAVVGIPTGIGAVVNARAQVRAARERESEARAHETEARMEAALASERTAIARELHDIAAHHLSGIALMSSAISQQIDTDPASAKASLADVRTQTRALLDELRGLVALLRHDDEATTAVHSLAGLEPLIRTVRERGLDVALSLPDGETVDHLTRGIGPLGQFAAYRTVQEALANAARHRPGGRCVVELRDPGEALAVVVINGPGSRGTVTPSEASGGFGLRGMQERAALTRAALSYGPTEDGGWRVELRVPRDGGADIERERAS